MKGTKRRQKGTKGYKKPESNEQNGDNKSIFINNYFWCKWTKFSNQKTKSS